MSASALGAKIKDVLLGMPLFVKVMGISLGTTVALGIVMLWQIYHGYYQLKARESTEQARFVAKILAYGISPLLREGQVAEAQRLLQGLTQAIPGIDQVQVLDDRGRPVTQASRTSTNAPGQRFFHAVEALPPGLSGSVSVTLNDDHAQSEVDWQTHRVIAATLIITLLGMVMIGGLMRQVTHPILELVRITRSVKAGQAPIPAAIHAQDEVGELAVAFNEMMVTVQQQMAVNHQLLRKIMAAEEEERKRVARELHDHTGQALASLVASLAAMKTKGYKGEVTDLLELATRTLSEVHDLSRTLHPSLLDDLGLAPALEKSCESLAKRVGLEVDFDAIGFEGQARLPGPLEVALYRIGQEALANAVHHGQARLIEVMVYRKPATVLLMIKDHGQGFDASNWRAQCLRDDRLGLLGIEERASLLGGTMQIESRPGAGACLTVEIPLAKDSGYV